MKFRNILLVSAAALFCTAVISAQISHTFVSGSGNDSNPCTFASPCATFAGALTNTLPLGTISAKDAGDFGPVAIGKSITIDGNNLGSITFNNTGNDAGIYITANVNVMVLNLTINGLGLGADGIAVNNGGIVTVDNCKIMNTTGIGIFYYGAGNLTVVNSRIESFSGNNGSGIWINGNAAENVVLKNSIIDASPLSNTNSGFFITGGSGSVKASLQNVTIMGAGNGAVWSYQGDTEITGSVLTQSYLGVGATNGGTISVASSLITSNGTGVCSNNGSKIRLDNNDIYDNTTAIANCGGIVKTSGTNKTSGTISIPASDVSDSVTF